MEADDKNKNNESAKYSFHGSGARVRTLRMRRGLSLTDLSVRSGVALAALSAIERGTSGLGIERTQALASALRVDVSELAREPSSRGLESSHPQTG